MKVLVLSRATQKRARCGFDQVTTLLTEIGASEHVKRDTSRVEMPLGQLHGTSVVREEEDLIVSCELCQDLQCRRGTLVVEVDEHIVQDPGHSRIGVKVAFESR